MTDWVPVKDREEFKDLMPLPEYSDDTLVGRISYSPVFESVFECFRRILESNEESHRAFLLTTEAIQACPGFYSAWRLRRELLVSLEVDLDVEIEFLNQVSISTPKNYQIWSYRREIVSLRMRCEGEMEFLRKIFDIDKKNIHAWGYRQWLVKKFELWGEDKEYALELIKSDAYNNSAWNQLIFISKHDGTVDSLERKIEETKFVLEFCLEKENECPFNYLRGLYSKETQELIKQYFLEIIKVQGISKNLLKTLAYFSYIDKNREIQEVCYEKLQVLDIVRQLFWKWKSETCEGDSSSSDLDEAVLKMLKSI